MKPVEGHGAHSNINTFVLLWLILSGSGGVWQCRRDHIHKMWIPQLDRDEDAFSQSHNRAYGPG